MTEQILDAIPADRVVPLFTALFVAIAALSFAILVVGLCWLYDRHQRSRIRIEDSGDCEPLGASALPRSVELAVEEAFYRAATPEHIARAFSTGAKQLTAEDVEAIWRDAKIAGRLADPKRPVYRDTTRWIPADRASDLSWRNAP